MTVNGLGIATPMHFDPIVRYRSYWAAHFYSALECVRYHNLLQYPGRKLAKMGVEDWSLAQLRGSAPTEFFSNIYQYMSNWGFQYLLVSLMNSRPALPVVQTLIGELERLWSITFNKEYSNYQFHVSGQDSDLSRGLELLFAEIFPDRDGEKCRNIPHVIRNSDICLILENPDTSGKVGVFGEVEGLKGESITWDSFWNRKSDYCVFAVGANQEIGSLVDYEVRYKNGLYRILITFQGGHFVVQDFQSTLFWIEHLFRNGPLTRDQIKDEEFGYFYNILKMNWNKPISEVLSLISLHMGPDDVVESVPGASPIITSIHNR